MIPDDLDRLILGYVKKYSKAGQKSYSSFLSIHGLHIPRCKVRDSLDPEGVM